MRDVHEIFAESLKTAGNAAEVFDRFVQGKTTRKLICIACGGVGESRGSECPLCRGRGVIDD